MFNDKYKYCGNWLKTPLFLTLLFEVFFIFGCKTPCACPDLYAPVCGENGKTYANPCEARCDKVGYYDGECPVYGIGTVIFSGDSTNDCDFLIEMLNATYKPDSLPPEFLVNDLFVSLKYRRLNQYITCDALNQTFQVIEVQEIDSY